MKLTTISFSERTTTFGIGFCAVLYGVGRVCFVSDSCTFFTFGFGFIPISTRDLSTGSFRYFLYPQIRVKA